MRTYYLWPGVGAIEDLEDCDTDEKARAALASMSSGDWTLWRREGTQAVLMGVHLTDSGERWDFNTSKGEPQ